MSFTKMFSSITDSTVWGEPDQTRIVWITLLAMANRDGFVHSSIPGLAHRARVSIDACEKALDTFMSPDPYSRTSDFEGRRIQVADGGWVLLNYLKYRETGNPVRAGLASEGYVYYVGIPAGDQIKIGFSKNPWARLDSLRTTEPRLEILCTERGTMQLEKDRHREFSNERLQGEWFKASPSLISLVSALSNRDERTCRGYDKKSGRTTTVVEKTTTVGAEAEAEAEAIKSKDGPRKRGRSQKVPMPEDFGISDRVKAWADEKGHQRLAEHLDSFKRKCAANGYRYVDWDAAFMEAIRGDWAKLTIGHGNGNGSVAPSAIQAKTVKEAMKPSETPLERDIARARHDCHIGMIDTAERDKRIAEATQRHRGMN